MMEERSEEPTVDEKKGTKETLETPDVKGKPMTKEKKTKAVLMREVQQLREQNAELKQELQKIRQAQEIGQEKPPEDARDKRPEGQGLCSPCATYLLGLQEQAATEKRGHQQQKSSKTADREEKINQRKPQKESYQNKSAQGKDVSKSGEGYWVMEGGSKFWRRARAEEHDGWVKVHGKKSHPRQQHIQVETSNRFSVLDMDTDEGEEEARYLIIGDSRVRPLGRVFCGERDVLVCKPGATVAKLVPTIQEELGKCEPEAVIVQVGVNDVGQRRSVKLVNDYTALLLKLKEARKPVIVTGILPRATASREWHSRALAANVAVEKLCSELGFHFVDLWGEFYDRESYYLRDGLHLSDEGARVLGEAYRNIVQGN